MYNKIFTTLLGGLCWGVDFSPLAAARLASPTCNNNSLGCNKILPKHVQSKP